MLAFQLRLRRTINGLIRPHQRVLPLKILRQCPCWQKKHGVNGQRYIYRHNKTTIYKVH